MYQTVLPEAYPYTLLVFTPHMRFCVYLILRYHFFCVYPLPLTVYHPSPVRLLEHTRLLASA